MISLNPEVLSSFAVAKIFKDTKRHVSSLQFSDDGELLLAADEDSIHLYNVAKARKIVSYPFKNDLCRWIGNSLLIAGQENIQIYDFNGHTVKRFANGHSDRIINCTVSTNDEFFLTSSLGNTVKLWDVKSSNPLATMNVRAEETVNGPPLCCFDTSGKIFIVVTNSSIIRMYDVRNATLPFASRTIYTDQMWSDVQFNHAATKILINTLGRQFYLVDGISPTEVTHIYSERQCNGSNGTRVSVGFTPRDDYIYSGNNDGTVTFYGAASTNRVAELNPFGELDDEDPLEVTTLVAFNPHYAMFASATTDLAFWIPNP